MAAYCHKKMFMKSQWKVITTTATTTTTTYYYYYYYYYHYCGLGVGSFKPSRCVVAQVGLQLQFDEGTCLANFLLRNISAKPNWQLLSCWQLRFTLCENLLLGSVVSTV